MRKFVYYQVLEKFSRLDPSNIELAYRGPDKTYFSLAEQGNLTIDDLIKKSYWQKDKCDLKHKEENGIAIGIPRLNETLYVRFIQA